VTNHESAAQAALQAGRHQEAVRLMREAAAAHPACGATHCNLGTCLRAAGLHAEAVERYHQAIRLGYEQAQLYFNLGNVLAELGQLPQAIAAFTRATELDPDMGDAWYNLGELWLRPELRTADSLDRAEIAFRRTLKLKPEFLHARNALGTVLTDLPGRAAEALVEFQAALPLGTAHVHNNLGLPLLKLGRIPEAMAQFDRALELLPELPDAHMNRAFARLLWGDWERGLPEYEARHACRAAPGPQFDLPRWEGQPGVRLLVRHEQGLGDVIMASRFLRELGCEVTLETPAELVGVMSRVVPRVVPYAPQYPQPAVDYQIRIMELLPVLGVRPWNVSRPDYLTPDPGRLDRWRQRIAGSSHARVGLVWQGNPRHINDRHRSLPLAALGPLGDVPDTDLYSFQVGYGSEQLADCSFPIRQLGLSDWEDTAAALCLMDAVVTVDTAVAHLAGALGLRVLLLLPYCPDWRWLLHPAHHPTAAYKPPDPHHTPWYGRMILLRQGVEGDWSGPVQQAAHRLRVVV